MIKESEIPDFSKTEVFVTTEVESSRSRNKKKNVKLIVLSGALFLVSFYIFMHINTTMVNTNVPDSVIKAEIQKMQNFSNDKNN